MSNTQKSFGELLSDLMLRPPTEHELGMIRCRVKNYGPDVHALYRQLEDELDKPYRLVDVERLNHLAYVVKRLMECYDILEKTRQDIDELLTRFKTTEDGGDQ